MANPGNDRMAALSREVLQAFDDLNGGVLRGFRPAHAKGIMLSGLFTPAPAAASLTRAPHLQRPSTPVTVRFSTSGGIPTISDNDPNASPRGIAIRFHLDRDLQTDIVGHSINGFPTRTAEELAEFLRAVHASAPGTPQPTPLETFLATHPAALRFVQTPRPLPSSFAHESFFAVNAFKFTNSSDVSRFGRYCICPDEPGEYLAPTVAATQPANFLFDEIARRLARKSVKFHILVQLAAPEDIVDDSTVPWPDDRPRIEFGTLDLSAVFPDNAAAQRGIIFDPVPRVDGIDPSPDPLIEARSAVYLASGHRRAAAAT